MDPTAEPEMFQFTQMEFGISSSPLIAQFVTQGYVKKYLNSFRNSS